MDERTARLIERARQNPERLQELLRSPDGQALVQQITAGTQGAVFQQAAQSAAQGNTIEAVKLVGQFLKTPDGAALAKRLREAFQK